MLGGHSAASSYRNIINYVLCDGWLVVGGSLVLMTRYSKPVQGFFHVFLMGGGGGWGHPPLEILDIFKGVASGSVNGIGCLVSD